MSYGVGRRHGLVLALLWLWCRPAATALIRPVAWEPPYATSEAPKKDKIKKKKKDMRQNKVKKILYLISCENRHTYEC